MPKSAWINPPAPPAGQRRLHDDPLLHALLAGREIPAEGVGEFLDPAVRRLPDPYLLPGMAAVVERVRRAIDQRETVGVFGDYDADGVTSVAIMTVALRTASGGALPAMTALPTRAAGYGLSCEAVEGFRDGGATLMIAVDCASSDHELVGFARSLGMDVVVLDHHEIHGGAPEGAIVGSARLEPGNVYRHLPAAGLCLLLATALARAGYDVGAGPGQEPEHLIDLAMVAVIADVCDLRDPVNRAIVRDGLRRLRLQPRPGLQALAVAQKIDPRAIDSRTIGMRLSPALNAAGRQGAADPALALLMAEEPAEVNEHVSSVLSSLNWVREQRSALKASLVAGWLADAERDQRPLVVFEAENCPHGIAGTLAGDLAKDVARPVIVLSRDGENWRGSARSWGDFDIGSALQEARELLIRTGGHRMAAGLSVRHDRVPALRDALEEIARRRGYVPAPAGIRIDADLPVERLTIPTLKAIDTLRPFGQGNPEPMLRVSGAPLRGTYVMGTDKTHLKLQLDTPNGPVSAILWGEAERIGEVAGAGRVDVVGHLKKNEYNGNVSAQLICEDFRPA